MYMYIYMYTILAWAGYVPCHGTEKEKHSHTQILSFHHLEYSGLL